MNVIIIILLFPAYFLLGYVTAYALSFIDNDFIDDEFIFLIVMSWPIVLALFITWIITVIVPKWMIKKLKEGGEE